MKKVLFILGKLKDEDIAWMIKKGKRQQLENNEVLIQQGGEIQNIYIILDGHFAVISENQQHKEIDELGLGEIVGEMSFIDSSPPSATVVARGAAEVIAIPKPAIQKKLDADPAFAARFFFSIALSLSARLRKANYDQQDAGDMIDMNVMDDIYNAGMRFKRILASISS